MSPITVKTMIKLVKIFIRWTASAKKKTPKSKSSEYTFYENLHERLVTYLENLEKLHASLLEDLKNEKT